MPDNQEVTQAKQWCNDARKLLKLGTFSSKGKTISKRASDVAKELKNLQKAVDKGKSTLGQQVVQEFTNDFKDIATKLKTEAQKPAPDDAEVLRLSNRLEELKDRLKLALATKAKSVKKAQETLDNQLDSNFPSEIAAMRKQVEGVSQHACALSIRTELQVLNQKLVDAQNQHDQNNHDAAIKLLREIPGLVQAASSKAGQNETAKGICDVNIPIIDRLINEADNHVGLPLVQGQLGGIKTRLNQAKQEIAGYNYIDAGFAARTLLREMNAMQPTLNRAQQDYTTTSQLFNNVAPLVQQCETHTEANTRAQDIQNMKQSLNKARTDILACRYGDAFTDLNQLQVDATAIKDDLDNMKLWHDAYDRDLKVYEDGMPNIRKYEDADKVQTLINEMDQLVVDGKALAVQLKWREAQPKVLEACNKMDDVWAKMLNAPFPSELKMVKTRFSKLQRHSHVSSIQTEIGEIDAKIKEAQTKFSGGELTAGRNLLIEAMGLCGPAELKAHKTAYEEKKQEVDRLIEALKQKNTHNVIDQRMEAIAGRMAEVKKAADSEQFAIAQQILLRISGDCAAAKQLLDSQELFEGQESAAKEVIDQLEEDGLEALKAVSALVSKLEGHAQSKFIAKDIKAIKELIKQGMIEAKKPDANAAKEALKQAVDKCGEAHLLAERHDEYIIMHEVCTEHLKELQKHKKADDIGDLINEVKKGITDAAQKVKERDHPAGRKLLRAAADLAQEALARANIRAKLAADTPTAADLEEILAQPGGYKALDQVINKLPPETPRKVFEAAIEARYGATVEQFRTETGNRKDWVDADPNAAGRDAKRIYELFGMVPEDHVRDNAKLRRLIRFTDDTGGAAYGRGTVFMNCGHASDPPSSEIGGKTEIMGGDEIELEDGTKLTMDPNCVPEGGSQNVVYFDWATLHEVGHAVDDKQGFMKGKGNNTDFGGWEEYGNDPTPLAEAVCKKFNFDSTAGVQYTRDYLAGNNPTPPDDPSQWKTGCPDLPEWRNRRTKVIDWCDAISQQNLWWNGGECNKRAIGDRVYQKAYSSQWNSYSLAARAKGITGYQFRAPAEWFAELYAAYHSKKLKESHPSANWLKDL